MAGEEKFKELKKLSPEERIKRLKELEEKDKEEIKKAHELIRDSEEEIDIQERTKRMRLPKQEEVEITKLFKPDEGESLEETVEKEKPRVSEEEIRKQREYLREIPTQKIEQRAEYLQNRVQETGYVSNEQRREISSMYETIKEREEARKQGEYKSATRNIDEQLSMTKRILGNIYQR
ncbi:MAG: hypothetical protein KAU20_04735 [Nanoarchaeota archaeon]|nr:hypothetical protein [Nanoarchaeota archaeon]